MTTSTGGSTGSFDLSDINTDIDVEGDELHYRLLETEPEQEVNNETNQEKLADENQEIIEKSKKKTSVVHSNFNLNKQNNTYSCIHCR